MQTAGWQRPLQVPTLSGGSARAAARQPRRFTLLKWTLVPLAILLCGTMLFHFLVLPLPVASLSVSTDPQGAAVLLDGKLVPGTTPMVIPIERDRHSHVIEVRKVGYLSTSYRVRYDTDIQPRVAIPLAPAPQPMPLP